MSAEESKRIVREFFGHLNEGDADAIASAYAEAGTCWTAGTLPFPGVHTRDEIRELSKGILGAFAGGLLFTVLGMTAEGNRVAVEAESEGRHASGKTYRNQYHFLFELQNGKILRMKEYLDTLHASEVLAGGAG